MTNYLTPTTENADSTRCGTQAQRNRYQHLYRSFCRKAENAPGKSRVVGTRTIRKEWSSAVKTIFLGKRDECGFTERRPSFGSRIAQRENSDTHSRKIILQNGRFSVNLEKFSKISALEFPERNSIIGKNFNYFLKKQKISIDNSVILEYNTRITLEQTKISPCSVCGSNAKTYQLHEKSNCRLLIVRKRYPDSGSRLFALTPQNHERS